MNQTKSQVHYVTIDFVHENQRIDNFLLTYLKTIPRTHIYRVLRKGEIRVNKGRVKPDYRLRLNDSVRIPPIWQREMEAKPKPRNSAVLSIEQHILFEDKGFLAINKPAGMPVHGGTGVSFGVIDLLRLARPKEKYLELAHRLDRDTSGCLLLVKKPSLLKAVHTLFREGAVVKTYWALVKGSWSSSLKMMDAPLLKNQLQSGERIVRVNPHGKSALTAFTIIEKWADFTLLEITLHTGRTHQIRVHTAYAGHPILGDEKYGDKIFNQLMRQKMGNRMFLHAKQLFLELPLDQGVVNISADLDDSWQACFAKSLILNRS